MCGCVDVWCGVGGVVWVVVTEDTFLHAVMV